jgi:hypothetical protein
MNFKLTIIAIAFLSMLSQLFSAEIVVTDSDIQEGQIINWTSDNTYILDGFVFVEEGASLNIEPGTVIKGKPGQGEQASALIICRGGKIYAEGTASDPIIFTAEADDPYDHTDLPLNSSGLWGGVIILGSAGINTSAGEGQIEGIPSTEPRGAYGGTVDDDNSGIFRYVSIRHGGTNIGADNEINGLTLGAVGSGTQIDHVEVFGNQDDGFEFFGGTVNVKYLVAAMNGDDNYDTDEGYRGYGQFLFVIQSADDGDKGAEQDGGTTPEDGLPLAQSKFYNVTYIGRGAESGAAKNSVLHIRDNSAASYYNSIFTDFGARAVYEIEDLGSGADSRERLEQGDIEIKNNLWYGFGADNELSNQDFVNTYLTANNNWLEDPLLTGISRTTDGGLIPVPESNSPAFTKEMSPYPEVTFLTEVNYLGAFGPEDYWVEGWTLLDDAGYLGDYTDVEEINIEGIASLGCYPNPVVNRAKVRFNLEDAQRVKIDLYNMLGKKVKNLVDENIEAGNFEVELQKENIPSGMYIIRMELPNKIITEKVVIE